MREEKLHHFLITKILREIDNGKFVLHLSAKQEQITDALKEKCFYVKTPSFAEMDSLHLDSLKGKFGFLIADMDQADLDDFDKFVIKAKEFLIAQGMLIVIATNMATFKNAFALMFGNDIDCGPRPYRAISPGFLRHKLLEKGFALQNRFWVFNDKMMIMASLK